MHPRPTVLLLTLLGAAPLVASAQYELDPHAITTAVPILTLSPDARGAALGEAGAATSPDANAAFYNAGKLGFVPYKYSVSLSYSPWLRKVTDDMSLQSIAGYGKIGERSAVAASLTYFALGNIDYRDGNNINTGNFDPKEFAFTVSYGQKLSDNFGLGVSARYVRSNLIGAYGSNDAQSGNSLAVDLGAYYSRGLTIGAGVYNLALGGAITNIGNKMTYADPENASFLPTNLRLGTALTREIDQYNKITLTFDANKLLVPSPYYEDGVAANDPRIEARNDERAQKSIISAALGSFSDAPGGFKEELREINLSGGAEYSYNDLVMARVGYFYEAPDKGDRQYLSLGLGVRYQVFGIDGTYLVPNARQNPLSETIRVSLHFNFNKLEEAFRDNGSGGNTSPID
ncbi:type IX secretion system outer membrane channel protein PorV [uncultured Hymenobacter sp.]|uniref:type IX secretion system outer membrane channel protein PorV n=1 Tax=uncultured Hymenobacter sp. TaxID=170016 RepID=UPI0035CC23BD